MPTHPRYTAEQIRERSARVMARSRTKPAANPDANGAPIALSRHEAAMVNSLVASGVRRDRAVVQACLATAQYERTRGRTR